MSQLCGPVCRQSKIGPHRQPVRRPEVDLGGDRRIAVFRKIERSRSDEHRRQDMRRDRQRIDAGIENAKTARAPDPVLVRMPAAHIFLPVDRRRVDFGGGKKGARGFHGGRVTRMPAGEKRDALGGSQRLQILDLADCRAGRLFQEDMLAGFQRRPRRLVAELRRHAERDGVDLDGRRKHVLDGLEVANTFDRGVRLAAATRW